MAKIDEWLGKDKLILLEGWARNGLSMEQIAKNVGVAKKTLYEWQKKESSISNALKKGREVVDFEVENALYKSAMSGNVTAQIFWLKNRMADSWKNKIVDSENEEAINNASEILVKIRKTVDDRYDRN